jgi:NTP pyrophosphatase (non-canonical NTP hydrolase)
MIPAPASSQKSVLYCLTEQVIKFRDAREWKQFHKPKDVALSLVLEAAEVMEHFQWKSDEEVAKHIVGHRDEIGEELADTLYWILLMSHDFGIDLKEAFEKKMVKNEAKYPTAKAKGNHAKYNQL